MPLKHSKPTLVQCKATTSSGERCKAKPHKGGLCFFHSDPKKAAELGRKGGRANRHVYESSLQEFATPESSADVRKMLAQTMADVRAGKLDPKIGSILAYIATPLLRAFEGDSPAQVVEPPSIYRALQFRRTSAGATKDEELRNSVSETDPAQTGNAQATPCKKDLGYEILDLDAGLPVTCDTTDSRSRSAAADQRGERLQDVASKAAQTINSEVMPNKQEEDFEILDYAPRASRSLGS